MAGRENTRRGISKKVLVTLLVLAALGLLAGFDAVRAYTFSLEVISAVPAPVVADGETTCELVVELRNARKQPVAGHHIFVHILEGGGNFTQARNTTDESGRIVLNFRPLRATIYTPATNVRIKIYDESNSIFFLIPKTIYYEIEVTEV